MLLQKPQRYLFFARCSKTNARCVCVGCIGENLLPVVASFKTSRQTQWRAKLHPPLLFAMHLLSSIKPSLCMPSNTSKQSLCQFTTRSFTISCLKYLGTITSSLLFILTTDVFPPSSRPRSIVYVKFLYRNNNIYFI